MLRSLINKIYSMFDIISIVIKTNMKNRSGTRIPKDQAK